MQDLWDVQQALYVFAGHRGPFGQLFLNIARAALKAAISLLLGTVVVLLCVCVCPVRAKVTVTLRRKMMAWQTITLWLSLPVICSGGGGCDWACIPPHLIVMVS